MSEEAQVTESQEVNEIEVLKSQLQEAQKAIEALSSKKDELLAETKKAKDERRKAAEQIELEKRQLAEKNGEYETLWKQTQETLAQKEKELSQERQDRRNEKINTQAIKLAAELAKGDAYKAELLSTFVAQSLANVADDKGQIAADLLNSVKQKFETEERYKPLLGGNLSVGGSAPGNTSGARSAPKELNQSEFLSMAPHKQREFIQNGGTVSPNKSN